MKEIRNIVKTYSKITHDEERSALITLINVKGSSYRQVGARMLVLENGEYIGGISGGCLEGDALKRAKYAIIQNKASKVTYDTTEKNGHQIGAGLGCNGIIDVLFAPLIHNERNAIKVLADCLEERKTNILITVIKLTNYTNNSIQPGDMFRYSDSESFTEKFPIKSLTKIVLSDISEVWEQKKSIIKKYNIQHEGEINLFIEILNPAIHLIIYGDNNDIYPLIEFAKAIGWKVTIVARKFKLNPAVSKIADEIISGEINKENIDENTAIILMSHDYKTDFENLKKTITTSSNYIGILGPKKRTKKMLEELHKKGIKRSALDNSRIFSPIGLDIGASTPEEIAISIIAEIQSFKSGRDGGFLKNRKGPIHN